jgi:hypothetical protein
MRKIAVGLLMLTLSSVIHAQKKEPPQWGSASMDVGKTKLRLGMTKAEVSERLAGVAFRRDTDDFWIIGTGNNASPSLQFTNGRLNFVTRNWETTDNDIVVALFGVITSLNGEGFSVCKVSADMKADPTMTAQRVWIACGEKTILVHRATIGGKIYNTVDEQLGAIN